MISFNGLIIAAIGTLLLYILSIVVFGRKKQTGDVGQQEIPLSELAEIWAESKRTGQIHIRDIAPLWRKSTITEGERSEYTFKYPEVDDWFHTNISDQPWFNQAEAHREICYQLLRMLEAEDPSPSVVNPSNDVEASWDTNTYNMLGRTSLLDHSLHVAEQTVALLIDAEAHHVIPDAMVAALGHDIGKLPTNRTHLYSLGEHPLAAGRVLAETKLFGNLSRKEEISRAIKHHHMRPEGLIGKILKKADQKARQMELEDAVNQQKQQAESGEETVDEATPLPAAENNLARQADADIYGRDEKVDSKNKTSSGAINQINISSWFEPDAFLDELKPYINRLEGRRFKAFSMPNGYVYFQARAIEEVTRKLAEKADAMDIATMADKDKSMQKVLYSVVEQFRTGHDMIARDLIKDQYFGGYFSIKMQSGKTMKGYFTPFKAEPFGSIAELENSKKGILKNFVSVDVYQS
ncbi:HD domain-containing protein [Desulfopila sp. IMCC35008]|uniref:HD domain-containing protein n=1 Tax=Desulfopila sp. IMCC35008 TaxID=2653858 RepID=UPI0013D09357|nr:HD domain-containing protein [Desulfopila sp. IMCC35008]